ncbi:MAG TPA: DUF932 domain-containing protein [Spirochaetota bacterium]|nr:DUF932 domain-containing protein [Spirochaetota bacterium]
MQAQAQVLGKDRMPQAVLAEKAHERVGKNYTFIPTYKIIDDLDKLGWLPVRAQEARVRKEEFQGFQKHIVRFRQQESGFNLENLVGELFPELVLFGDHRGMGSFKLSLGLFRIVCTNGLVTADEIYGSIRISHRGYTLREIERMVKKFAKTSPKLVDDINKFKTIELTEVERETFAADAMKLRWGDLAPVEKPSDLLRTRRSADRGNSLWATYNVLQENLMKGGIRFLSRSENDPLKVRRNRTRAVAAPAEEMRVNQGLWQMMVMYAAIANNR